MPPEKIALTDFAHVLSTELDLQEALSSGLLDGYAIRNVGLQRTSFDNKRLNNVLVHRVAMPHLSFVGMRATALQMTESALRGSALMESHFDGLNMLNCEAIECDFSSAVIENSGFYESTLSNASFRRAKLLKTQFQSAELYGASFEQAFMTQCQFSDPKMGNASLTRTNFSRALIIDTSLKSANLHASNFSDAILIRVDLRGANLVRADLRGTTMINCQINPGDLDGALR